VSQSRAEGSSGPGRDGGASCGLGDVPPPAGRSRWTTRLLAKAVGLTSGCVADVLRRHNLKPHRVRTSKVSQDPAFAAKVGDIVGLYLHPPEHAVVLSVDEKTSIQALERTQLPLPLRSGRATRHTHDYRRHGVVDLYAALEVATGQVTHRVSATHTAADFLTFMRQVVRANPRRELHVILDNSSSHSTPEVRAWCAVIRGCSFTTGRRVLRGSTKWKASSAFSGSSH
jgi:hypothetical protein